MSIELLKKTLTHMSHITHEYSLVWRNDDSHVEKLFQYFQGLDDTEIVTLFETAQDAIGKSTFPAQLLWIFCHPTLGIFQYCIRNKKLCKALLGFCLVCASISYAGKHHKKSDRAKKKFHRKCISGDLYQNLAATYADVLALHLQGDFSYFSIHGSRGALNTFNLFPRPYPEPKSYAHAEREHRKKIIGKDFGFIINLTRIMESSEESNDQDVQSTFEKMIAVTPALEIPSSWKTLSFSNKELGEAIAKTMKTGRWFTFIARNPEGLPASCHHRDEASFPVPHTVCLTSVRKLLETKAGLLPIGFKIHCGESGTAGREFLMKGSFSAHNADTCFNLPPVGNSTAAKALFEKMAKRAGIASFLDNPDFQIQVCSPGRLTSRHAAILGVAFYLGSDRVRRYKKGDFKTSHEGMTGDRLIIHDAAGSHNSDFTWWGKDDAGKLKTSPLPIHGRTDVLTCQSLHDIALVNLVATLLVHVQHAQCDGYWSELGREFVRDIEVLLARHQLAGVLDAEWIHSAVGGKSGSDEFWSALEELMDCAFQDVIEITLAREAGDTSRGKRGILSEMQTILKQYRKELKRQAALAQERSQ